MPKITNLTNTNPSKFNSTKTMKDNNIIVKLKTQGSIKESSTQEIKIFEKNIQNEKIMQGERNVNLNYNTDKQDSNNLNSEKSIKVKN